MSRRIVTTLVGAALVMGAAVPAFAQQADPVGLSLRLGLFLPTSGAARGAGDGWFGAGVDYRLLNLPNVATDGTQRSLSLSLDFASRGEFRTVPVLVNYVVRRNELYAFGGVGVSFGRVPTFGGRSDRTRFAYQIGAGYDFNQGPLPLFLEAKFLGNERSELNGFGIFAGVRF